MSLINDLKITSIINAWGTVTKIGGSTMQKPVLKAMEDISQSYLSLNELQKKAGEYLAKLLEVEGVFITNGAASGITLSTSVCIAGSDVSSIYQLPDTSNMKNEVLILKSHRFRYDQGVKIAGGVIVEVGLSDLTLEEQITKKINPKTAMFLYLSESENLRGSLPLVTVSKILEKHKIPLIVDAAAELPPVENFKKFINEGADLVIFSGGKDIRGPQSSGLILGKKELIDKCFLNYSPNHCVCRGMKIDKETIAGLTKAVQIYIGKDWEKEFIRYDSLNNLFCNNLKKIKNISFKRGFPTEPGIQPSCIERVYFKVLEDKKNINTKKLILETKNKGIYFGEYQDYIVFNPQMLSVAEVQTINKEINNIFF